ncbi:unnamed protein product [Penicillium salamii]|uniref:Uncharacterized protein n=1 Tax=Penicillium salamii TaxID=1612424 RepID=A0A9W4J0B1_9EURO|nr:unnamed protein product [Penicillium salamii]CAG8070261.1 unnamed protein product [Penicillium salamii]CAG8098124.1 unnamed protein product [Penicillium salamii]CAG8131018.1 unnamed protein product [Penicillium salamii]CAG8279003.1 unnamed protein product [Penicillium salamii]
MFLDQMATMKYPKLYVVFESPRYGNYYHWALQIENGEESIVFEVEGEHPQFVRKVLEIKAEESGSFLGKEYVGVISKPDIQRVKDVASTIHVDNETVEWDCQDYVLEILDKLEEDYILDENDGDYRDARAILKDKRGSMA